MCYTIDFRKKVLSVREKENLTFKQTAVRFDIGIASITRWLKKIEPCKTRNKPAVKINMEDLKIDIKQYPDAYQFERAKRLNVSTSCIFFALKRLGVSYKKNSASSEGRRRKTSYL